MQTILSIVLGSYNRKAFLKKTILTIRNELERCGFKCEIIVVDGGSTDGSVAWLTKQKDIITIIQHNRGQWRGKEITRRSWGYFMNLAFKAASGKYIGMISDDCLVIPNAFKNGIAHFEKKISEGQKVGAMAFYWRNWPQDKDYFVGLTLGDKMFVNHGLYLKSALEEVSFIDEDSYSFYHADGDLCLKLWNAGYTCVDSPESFIEHYADANTFVRAGNLQNQQKDWSTYVEKWQDVLKANNSEGGWEYKKYNDDSATADLYKRLYQKDKMTKVLKHSKQLFVKPASKKN
jgi:glycosyltransferase involved in cell wall biosynthesis